MKFLRKKNTKTKKTLTIDIPKIKVVEDESKKGRKKKASVGFISSLKNLRHNKKHLAIVAGVFASVFLITSLMFVYPVASLYISARALMASAEQLQNSVASQNISEIKSNLEVIKRDFYALEKSYSRLSWGAYVPFVEAYYKDGRAVLSSGSRALDTVSVVIEIAEPYADMIGFGAETNEAQQGATANERIDFLIHTIDDILPHFDEIAESAKYVQSELSRIDPNRYPETFRGIEVRSKLVSGLEMLDQATEFLVTSKPLLESAPYLLGIDDTRTYLLLFQNDKELRATGGFWTAYSTLEVTDGKILPVSSNDIYNLDGKYTPVVPAPDPVIRYIEGPYLISRNYRLRDMNWSPDFRESIELFVKEAKKAGIGEIDGVIAVDTHVVVKILDVIGGVEVPGFGFYSSEIDPECNCPQVVHELELYADIEGPVVWSQDDPDVIIYAPANYLNRKDIVGPLMNTIMSNTLGQPKEKLPNLFTAAWESLMEKSVMLYVFDEKVQEAVETFGIAGRIVDYDGDYLHISDSNLGGRKSNLYVTQQVEQEVEISEDGSVVKTVNITYQNPQDYDGWLNSVLPNWTRIYVPKGSVVIETSGFEDEGEIYEELGKTVISGGFRLRPKGVKRITIKYSLPFKADNEYRLLVQKQPGTGGFIHSVSVNGKDEEFILRTDRELKFSL